MYFEGVQRRFNLIGKINNTKVFDDYAHHPQEIRASMGIARLLCKGKIIVVFQPHRYSRTKELFNDFIKILKEVDILVLEDIYFCW